MPEEGEEKNDWQRHSEEPKQDAASHDITLTAC
jgi:hypothetical protein